MATVLRTCNLSCGTAKKREKRTTTSKTGEQKIFTTTAARVDKNKGKVQVPVVTSAVQPPMHNSGGQQVKIPAALIMPQNPPVQSFPKIQVHINPPRGYLWPPHSLGRSAPQGAPAWKEGWRGPTGPWPGLAPPSPYQNQPQEVQQPYPQDPHQTKSTKPGPTSPKPAYT